MTRQMTLGERAVLVEKTTTFRARLSFVLLLALWPVFCASWLHLIGSLMISH